MSASVEGGVEEVAGEGAKEVTPVLTSLICSVPSSLTSPFNTCLSR